MRDAAASAAQWVRAETIFDEVTAVPPTERRAAVDRLCVGNAALAADVFALLDGDAAGVRLLDGGIAATARALLDDAAGSDRPVPDVPFGPYRAVRYLNAGGMGVVYRAEHDDGTVVALKVLRDATLSPARRERFAAEQRTLARLHHPNIARLYDAGTLADGTPWIAMEYVDGDDLIGYCRQRDCPMPERLRLFRAVCEAVQYAHEQMIVHRDLKPSNILVAAGGAPTLLDFGIAKSLDPDDARDPTRTGFRLLTPAYAAPEQFRGDDTGAAIDVYALGVLLYELVTGRLPFDVAGRSPGEAEAMILTREPERPSVVARRAMVHAGSDARTGRLSPVAGVSRAEWDDLDVLCLTAMRKEPARRYRTVLAFMQDVDRYLRHQPLAAQPDTLGYRGAKFVRRNWRPLAAAMAVLLLVSGLVSFYTVRLATSRNEALAEAARAQRVLHLLRDMVSGGDEETGPADTLRVITLVRRGVQQLPDLAGDPAVQADMYETLGRVEQALSEFPAADSLLGAALARRRAYFGPNSPEVTASLIALGELRDAQARHADAERLLRTGLARARRQFAPDDPTVADATLALGVALQHADAYDESTRVLGEAVRIREATGRESRDLALALTELANTHFYAGRLDVADSLDRRVLAIDERLVGPRHPWIADDLINLGAVAYERQHYAEAERLDRRALDVTRAFYPEAHYKTASNLYMLSKSLVEEGKYDEAGTLLREALAIQRWVFGPVHTRVANVLNGLGRLALARDSAAAALGYYRQAAAVYRAVSPSGSAFLGVALANMASAESRLRHYASADSLFREALAVYARVLPPRAPNIAIARIKLGGTLLLERRYAEAAVETRAGYDVLAQQRDPPARWLRSARTDLVAEYEAMHDSTSAGRFRAELAVLPAPLAGR
ncbi:MAG TPA: serine/threonine-protein kinase [Gemmatirosa sp.]